jgi:hypothetical protein
MSKVIRGGVCDHNYYDITLFNNSTLPIEAKFSTTSNDPILENINGYNISVNRFSISSFLIPLMLWENHKYEISMKNQATGVIEAVAELGPLPDDHIMDRAFFTLLLDIALRNIYLNLDPAIQAILLERIYAFLENDGRITLLVRETYFNNPYLLLFNDALYRRLPNFTLDPTLDDNVILWRENPLEEITIGGNKFYKVSQSSPAFNSLGDIDKIVITTNMPVKSQFTIETGQNSANSGDNSLNILTDFNIDLNLPDPKSAGVIIYEPAFLRQINMIGQGDLKRIDFFIYWKARNGSIHPVLLAPGEAVNMKLSFIRRNTII